MCVCVVQMNHLKKQNRELHDTKRTMTTQIQELQQQLQDADVRLNQKEASAGQQMNHVRDLEAQVAALTDRAETVEVHIPTHPHNHTPTHTLTQTPTYPHTHTPTHPHTHPDTHIPTHPRTHTPPHPRTHTPRHKLRLRKLRPRGRRKRQQRCAHV